MQCSLDINAHVTQELCRNVNKQINKQKKIVSYVYRFGYHTESAVFVSDGRHSNICETDPDPFDVIDVKCSGKYFGNLREIH